MGSLEDAEVDEFKFVFRPTSVLPNTVERSLTQPEAIHLLYIQGVASRTEFFFFFSLFFLYSSFMFIYFLLFYSFAVPPFFFLLFFGF